jgi:hypothetical protein
MPSRTEASRLLLEPAGSLVEYLAQETLFAGLAERGISTLIFLPTLIDAAEAYTKSLAAPPDLPWDKLRAFLAESPNLAKEEENSDFGTLRSHSVVAMWSAIETNIDALNLNMVRLYPEKLSRAAGAALPPSAPDDQEVKRLYSRWKSTVSGLSSNIIDRQLRMLNELGLSVSLSERHITLAIEICEARNIIVHNRSLVDERFVGRCPQVNASVGQRYLINREKFLEFSDALSAYSLSTLEACTNFLLAEIFDDA